VDPVTKESTGCEVQFGGVVTGKMRKPLPQFMLGSLLSAVRWEGVCVSPLVLLPSDAALPADSEEGK